MLCYDGISRPSGWERIETVKEWSIFCAYDGISRPSGWERIETLGEAELAERAYVSPGPRAGSGLKLWTELFFFALHLVSPGPRAGSGLKRKNVAVVSIPNLQYLPALGLGAD